ncbi:hypothetical protein [Methylobacterium sp. Leaf100]|uniref:hypothetical protein n=1 Tax=Methylobacterium sp. Leaf100 TaxID=1736252 RepID=UPI003297E67A
MGAPLPYRSANTSTGACAICRDRSFQVGLVPYDADDVVVDLDPVYDRLQPSLAEQDLASRDVLAHQRPEPFDQFRGDGRRWTLGDLDTTQRRLGAVALQLQRRQPLS